MLKCPVLCILGNTNFPGKLNFGASLATPPRCNFLATKPTGLSAGLVATYNKIEFFLDYKNK